MTITDTQLLGWMEAWLWPMVRIGGLLAIAPVLGARTVPVRIRVALAVLLTLALAPLLPAFPAIPLFSALWWLETARQLLIGLAMGFIVMLVFEAVVLGGEMMAYIMGLSFAQLVDPLRGAGTPVAGQVLMILGTLLFLSVGGHLRLIEALAQSFQGLPIGGSGLDAKALETFAIWGGNLFEAGLQLALPLVMALLLVHLAFGVMSRSAPALSALSVGFPITLAAGLVMFRFSLPSLQFVMERLLDLAFTLLGQTTGPVHG